MVTMFKKIIHESNDTLFLHSKIKDFESFDFLFLEQHFLFLEQKLFIII